ncbi:MAG TPA: CheR family methyltransferase [Gemmataceae bacterium]|nr:CheR family methyltransferase [Gemmataceae bacterium]
MSTEESPDPVFDDLLTYLRRNRGFDFSGYKRTSLERRIRKRMEAVGIGTFSDYVDYLEVHPDEFVHLFNTILINVTSFFRDPQVWEYLGSEVVPRIVAAKRDSEPLRVWSAGCASGEEAYTLGIILAEALGLDAFRERVKIYGTDIDNDALNQARQASYTLKDLEDVRPDLHEKYFEPNGDRRLFRKDLRRNVIFGRHDLMQDAPISRLDLLVCRNCLMYLNAETQARILERFHFAVLDGGYMVLGKAEMLLTHGNTFNAVDLKRRVFQKVQRGTPRIRLWTTGHGNGGEATASPLVNHIRIREAAFDSGAVPQVVVDANGFLTLANQQARGQFGLPASDLGRPFNDLDLSFRPADLRPAIEQATSEGKPVTLREVEWLRGPNESEYLDIQVAPLRDHANNGLLGVSITFTTVSQHRRLQEELRKTNQELESAYEELQSSNEELETTNEELQSTVEELETTNEELQSTNEELETMNEELQSANEELQTMNEELRQRSDELNQVNTFLESILGSFGGGVVVVDRDLMILVWNHRAEDLWGLRPEEVKDRHFLNLDIGLPVADLRQPIKACLAGEPAPAVVVDAVNRRGKAIRCQVQCTPLLGPEKEVRGAILLMEEAGAEKTK